MPRSRDVMLPPFWVLVERHGDELLVHARRMAGDQLCQLVRPLLAVTRVDLEKCLRRR